jgi:hypothetical protein
MRRRASAGVINPESTISTFIVSILTIHDCYQAWIIDTIKVIKADYLSAFIVSRYYPCLIAVMDGENRHNKGRYG